MALPKKGTRRIRVDGREYRWAIRKKPTYCQGALASPMTFAAECVQAPQTMLLVTTTVPRPDNWLQKPSVCVKPAQVAEAIRQAHRAGWQPGVPGSAFVLKFDILGCEPLSSPRGQ
ncbi:MAG: hypothetical protein C5B50_08690 [Verrucomicrobia bacterium]|nr:MAG: hypothetical protein C5B50_08690 [Verrucomicrobiota bacterium]